MKTMMYEEEVNVAAVHYLFAQKNSWLAAYYDEKKKPAEDIKKLKKYLLEMMLFGGKATRKYSYARSLDYGRLYSGNSIQGIQKHFRGLLCNGVTTDIDMINAHPNILLYVCKKHDIKCPNLEAYVKDRDSYLNELIEQEPKLTRDDAKELFLIATNSNRKNYGTKYYFLKDYDTEMKRIQCELLSHEDYQDVFANAKKSNLLGSNLNHILCKYENDILQTMVEHLELKKYKVHALMFDGLMIYGDHYENMELLQELEDMIYEAWRWNIKLCYKPHSTKIEIPSTFTYTQMKSYEAMKEEFEQKHLKVGDVFIKESDEEVKIMKRNNMFETYEHLNYMGDEKKESFINAWFKDDKLRTMDKMDVYPKHSLCPPDTYNLWRPFRCELMKDEYEKDEEGLAFVLNHIKILCNNEDEVYEFVLKWFAQMILHPESKSCLLIFISNEGVGKGLLMELLRQMLGERKLMESANPARDVWGHFNSAMQNSFLVNINEAGRKDTFDMEGKIKSLITDQALTINGKGMTPFDVKSFHRYIWTTNLNDPVSTSKDDRRKVIIRCSDEKIGDSEYFKTLSHYVSNVNTVRTVYDYFKSLPDVPYKFTKDMLPVTVYHKEMQEMQKDVITLFLEHFVCEHNGIKKFTNYAMFEMFKNFCHKNNYKCEYTTTHNFGMKLTRMRIDGIGATFAWKEGGKVYNGRPYELEKIRKHLGLSEDLVPDNESVYDSDSD